MEYWSIGKSDISPISGGEALKPFCEVNLIVICILKMLLLKFIYPTNIKSGISPVKPVLYINGGQVQHSITPTLHYLGQFYRQGALFFKQPQKTAIRYDCNGVSHAQI